MAKRILVVDDEPDIRDILRILLEGEGFEVEEAENGKDALEKIQKRPPDLVITDYVMPEMDGEELCRKIKKDLLIRHIPVIMLTGKKEDVTDKIKGIDAGADDYVVKTADEKELLARIKMVLRRTEMDLDANPLTRLPGNVSILNEIESRIKKGEAFAVCYIDLDKFKNYNDKYGFEMGDRIIQKLGGVDIALLGIGRNGHIAFNEPGTEKYSRTRVVELSPATKEQNSIYFGGKEKVPEQAITVGIETILSARTVILLASGESKSRAIQKMFAGESSDIPASFLLSHPDFTLIVDTAAAKKIEK